MRHKSIIIFDDECNLCNRSVNFIIKRDLKKNFLFTSLNNDFAQSLIQKYNLKIASESIILIKNNKTYIRTDAILEVIKNINGFWYIFGIFKIIPRSIRDYFYKIIARNRYNFFGKDGKCLIPTDDVKSRFNEHNQTIFSIPMYPCMTSMKETK